MAIASEEKMGIMRIVISLKMEDFYARQVIFFVLIKDWNPKQTVLLQGTC